jgi:hypothetical protein
LSFVGSIVTRSTLEKTASSPPQRSSGAFCFAIARFELK